MQESTCNIKMCDSLRSDNIMSVRFDINEDSQLWRSPGSPCILTWASSHVIGGRTEGHNETRASRIFHIVQEIWNECIVNGGWHYYNGCIMRTFYLALPLPVYCDQFNQKNSKKCNSGQIIMGTTIMYNGHIKIDIIVMTLVIIKINYPLY